ncbi:hypothetical protein L9F63_013407, partial [Diploptera punctata]
AKRFISISDSFLPSLFLRILRNGMTVLASGVLQSFSTEDDMKKSYTVHFYYYIENEIKCIQDFSNTEESFCEKKMVLSLSVSVHCTRLSNTTGERGSELLIIITSSSIQLLSK